MAYLLVAFESMVAMTFLRSTFGQRLAALTMAATAALGSAVAGYQTWIQRFARDVSCTADQPWWEQFVNWAGRHVPILFESTGLCNEAGWKFFSLSIAEWSLLIFTGMTVAALRAAWETKTVAES
jgi:disulfide bond formation protein DsbB